MVGAERLGVRWTIGDVSERGFEALRLAVWGGWKLFGPEARYAVCVNTLPVEEARARTGEVPEAIEWHESTLEVPAFIRERLDPGMAEGVAWKFSPLRVFPDRYELAVDNDCVLWDAPEAIRRWLTEQDETACVFAEDVARMPGLFSDVCGPEPRNGGIRGLPPGLDYEGALRAVLEEKEAQLGEPALLASELDEQGLQVAAVERFGPPLIVRVEEVTICSPFPPHLPHLGTCGAHFCGTNAKRFPWEWNGRNGIEYTHEHWLRHRDTLYQKIGIEPRA